MRDKRTLFIPMTGSVGNDYIIVEFADFAWHLRFLFYCHRTSRIDDSLFCHRFYLVQRQSSSIVVK